MTAKILRELNNLYSQITKANITSYLKNLSSEQEFLNTHNTNKFYFYPYESHKYIEFAIQISGRSYVNLGKNSYSLEKNQMVLINKNMEHRLVIEFQQETPVIMLWIAVTNDTIRPGLSTYTDGSLEKQWALDIIAPGGFLLGSILNETETNLPNRDEAIFSYLSAFLILLIRKLSFSNKIWDSDRKRVIVHKTQEYILANISKNITLKELSEIVSVSTSYLCRVFKQYTGTTVFQYILDTKIRLASECLVSGELTLAEIAEEYGFYDQFHFSKVFKSYTHVSPSEYIASKRKATAHQNEISSIPLIVEGKEKMMEQMRQGKGR